MHVLCKIHRLLDMGPVTKEMALARSATAEAAQMMEVFAVWASFVALPQLHPTLATVCVDWAAGVAPLP